MGGLKARVVLAAAATATAAAAADVGRVFFFRSIVEMVQVVAALLREV